MNARKFPLALVLLAVAAGAWAPSPAAAAPRDPLSVGPTANPTWNITRLTSGAIDGELAIAVDDSGHARIGHRRQGARPGLYLATNRSGTWVENLAVSGGQVFGPVIALGPNGADRIAYTVEGASPGLVFASMVDGRWTRTRVSDGSELSAASLVVDRSDRAWIAFVRYKSSPGIYVASNVSGSWVTTRVTESLPIAPPSLAVDASGHSHLAFAPGGPDSRILYATDRTGRWVVSRITRVSAAAGFDSPAIAIDARGAVHIAFARLYAEDMGIYHVTKATGSWTRPRVVASGPFAKPTLAIAPSGTVEMAFQCIEGELDARHCGIYAASNASGRWATRRLGAGDYGTLAIVPTGQAHAAFNAAGTGILYRTETSGRWTAERVTVNHLDSCPAIGSAPDGSLRIGLSRYGAAGGARVMTNRSGSWATGGPAVVPGSGCPALAVDATGRSHIVSATCEQAVDLEPTELPCDLFYAVDGPAGWSRVLLSSTADGDIDIAVDRNGRAHVAYGGYGTDALVYATNRSGHWTFTTVARGTLRPAPSIAVDRAGTVHIAYSQGPETVGTSTILYVTNGTGHWVERVVARNANSQPAIAAGASGRVHVLFTRSDAAGRSVYDSANSTGLWVTKRVASGTREGRPALALDTGGGAHVAFTRVDGGMSYAVDAGGSWITSPVTADLSDFEPSLVVDTAGTVHLAFVRAYVGLYYAHS